MAQVASKYTSEWIIDDVFRYLTRVVGRQSDLALYEIEENIRAGRLPVKVTHTLAGTIQGESTVKPDYWRACLTLRLVDDRAEVVTREAWVDGEFAFTVKPQDVHLVWSPPADLKGAAAPAPAVELFRTGAPGRPTAMDAIVAEFERRFTAGEVIPRRGGCAAEAEQLAEWWKTHRSNNAPTARAGSIKNKILPRWNSLISKT